MTQSIRAAIVGSTGYGGVELIRLLLTHPHVNITSIISASYEGKLMAEQFPHLSEIITETLDGVHVEQIRDRADVVFTATPSGVSAKLVPQLVDAGLTVIDLSGDFRIKDRDTYEQWYKHEAAADRYLEQAVYGLCEVYADRVRSGDVKLLSNPGCYATTTLLGLTPLVKAGWIDHRSIIIDAKSGVSGAGRGTSQQVHYSEINENLVVYKVNRHQHIPEIEQVLTDVAGEPVTVTFTTHLTPMTRGIMCTMYSSLKPEYASKVDEAALIGLYREFYADRQFVRVREAGKWPATKEVWGSNYCDIGFSVDPRTGRVTVVSVSDNVMKGAAGQAVQNLNLMMGWEEHLGLQFTPVYP